jgi:GDP-L-fucose synthase
MTSVIIKNDDKILITGGHGFLGSHLTEVLLANGFSNLVVPTHKQVNLVSEQETHLLIHTEKPKAVIHLAGVVGGIGANQANPGKFFYENMAMGMNVVHCAMRACVERVVMIGTVCAYPKHTPVPFAEEHLWFGYPEETNAPYGVAKRGLIQMCESYNIQYGMKNIALLPTNLYGPRDDSHAHNSHVIPALIRKFHEAILTDLEEVKLWGTGNVSREFLYVRDCAYGIMKALRHCGEFGPVNLGTGEEVTIRELATIIAGLMDYNGQVVWQTHMPDGQPRRSLKVDKSKKLFNWRAQTSLMSGLVETILWYEEAYRNGNIDNYI